MIYGDGEPLELENSRQFFDIVAPILTEAPASDRVLLAAIRLCDAVNHLMHSRSVQQDVFRDIPGADVSRSPQPSLSELADYSAPAEGEVKYQLTEEGPLEDITKFDVTEAQIALSAMVEHVSGIYKLTDKQASRALLIARRREARAKLVADDRQVFKSITLKTEPPTPSQGQPGK